MWSSILHGMHETNYIEVKLLEGGVLRCPSDQCESTLTLKDCANLLTHKLKAMWEKKDRRGINSCGGESLFPKPNVLW